MTAEVPLGGVGRAGVGTGGGTNGSSGPETAAGAKNAKGSAGRAGVGAGGATGGGAGSGTSGGDEEAGAGPAGAGAGAGVGTGGEGLWLAAVRCFSGTVPHGWRTLPAWTVTGSEDERPPALIVTIVVPGL